MKIPSLVTQKSITVVVDNKPFTIKAGNTNFNAVKDELKKGDDLDMERLKQLLDVQAAVQTYVHGAVSVENGIVKHNGSELHGVVVEKILSFMRDGLDHRPLVAFLERLLANPSRRAIEELYTFLEHKNMPITPEGHFIAYKGVGADFYSITGGDNSKVLQGTTNDRGQILNAVGETIEVTRNYVDDDARRGCSAGLHAGSYEYAENFANGHLMLVQIDPADVVSVPTDCSCQKLRTSKYKVVDEIQPTGPLSDQFNDSYVDDDFYGDDDYDEFDEDYDEDVVDEFDGPTTTDVVVAAINAAADEEVAEDEAIEDAYDAGYQAGYNKAKLSEKAKKQKRDANGRFVTKKQAKKAKKAKGPKRDASGRFAKK